MTKSELKELSHEEFNAEIKKRIPVVLEKLDASLHDMACDGDVVSAYVHLMAVAGWVATTMNQLGPDVLKRMITSMREVDISNLAADAHNKNVEHRFCKHCSNMPHPLSKNLN